jgi:hypothetical protein
VSNQNPSETSSSPIDLNKPVENPKLVEALEQMLLDPSNQAKDVLLVELNRAIYLAVIFTDEMHTTAPDENGRATVKEKSLLKVLHITDERGNAHLPLFTDWGAIRKYLREPVDTLVLPAADAWSWALTTSAYSGIVINPAHNALPISRELIEYLAKQIERN